MSRLNVGVIGLGRLGRVYARDLAGRIPETRLVAVADPAGTVAQDVAAEFEVPRSYTDPMALIDDPSVEWILSALGAGLVLFGIVLVYPRGLGLGDVKLSAVLGAGLGVCVIRALFVGFVVAVGPAADLCARRGHRPHGA